jgi:rhodanese-related sulfurtransferase
LLSPKEVLDKKTNDPNVIVVDVRTPEEYAAGHIENARLINFYDTNWSEQMSQLDKNKPVIVYCAVGGRSGKAYATLQKLGFKSIYDMKGGFDAWKKNQLPIAH